MATIHSPIADVFTIADQKTAPQALFATLQAAKRGQVDKNALQKAASEFESVFLGQMLQAMMPQNDDPNSLFGNEQGDEAYNGLIVDEYAKQISKSGGIGIASYIEREFLGTQEIGAADKIRKYQIGMLRMEPESVPEASEAAATTTIAATTASAEASVDTADAIVQTIFQGETL